MAKLFLPAVIVLAAIVLLLFVSFQISFWMHAESARAVTIEYMGRGVCMESQMTREENYFPNGKSRLTFQIPPFNEQFRMHTASFNWNENRHLPPDAGSNANDTWVGTCLLTPKTPWRYMDIFGILGPIKCSVYGDWHVESDR